MNKPGSRPPRLRIGPKLLRGLYDKRELALHVFLVDLVALGVRGEAALRANADSAGHIREEFGAR